MTETRRLAAILAADVVGYSRLMAADESGTLARFKSLRAYQVEPALRNHGGRIVGEAGDSLLVEFGTASAAVACAVEVQGKLAELNTELPEDRRIRFRIGVNLGEVIVDGTDIHGDGVNVAARIEQLTPAGGICVSLSVHEQVEGGPRRAFALSGGVRGCYRRRRSGRVAPASARRKDRTWFPYIPRSMVALSPPPRISPVAP